MSVVIVGGNECMVRQYKMLCQEYCCEVKVFPKKSSSLKSIGSPDLMVLFTGTVSHKMVQSAMSEIRGGRTKIARSHTSSMSALRNILEQHVEQEETVCLMN